ncbi:MAG: tryptophan-rich sensory protein [Clostridia bacterium]|nr:tryptophan-rich sensory protein [Clostridia bacterium]
MVLKLNLKRFLISLAIPLLVGGLSALVTSGNMDLYSKINAPPLAPPGWLFPVVWTILYTLMGVSVYLVWSSDASYYKKQRAITLFALQLFLNFIWSPVFFNMQKFLAALIILTLLLVTTILMTIAFYKISKTAGLLQIPYVLWLAFAWYLNFAIYLLN